MAVGLEMPPATSASVNPAGKVAAAAVDAVAMTAVRMTERRSPLHASDIIYALL
jgi:hypothetical protein